MISKSRKVCFCGPTRFKLAQEVLHKSGCELVLGRNVDDFPSFRYEKREFIRLIGDSDILFGSGRDVIGGDILDSCDRLQAVVKSSIGIENVDVDAATELGILVCNSPTPENYMGVAEATVGFMVALFKRLKFNEAHLRTGGWKEPQNRGALMMRKTIGIIGLGRIGREVAKRLGPWSMRLVGYDPYVAQETVAPLGVERLGMHQLLREADLVTIHVVLTKETRHMIGLRELKMMKSTAYLVNTSRGAVCHEADLIQALNEGVIAGAALDVFEPEPLPLASELREVDPTRLIMTPHIIGNNPGSLDAGQRMAAESILSILEGRAPDTVVNPKAIERWKQRFWT
ncbi:MAG TPA: NAD(P)-dependent oxidoreductase [Candidatus Binatia bacterium]|jgi:phosphoglycerate dehydrogenase-like enzyme|nr:NAD(P)-dependent oxidoreductase [Candidatus Binatia bacterium]